MNLLIACLAASVATFATAAVSPWDINQIKKDPQQNKADSVVFRNGTAIELGTFMTRYIGRVDNKAGAPPLLIFEGMPCFECDADPVVHIYSVTERRSTELMYPGKVSFESDVLSDARPELRYDTRIYYGDCISGQSKGVVIFENAKNEDGTWARNVRVITLQADGSTKSADAEEIKISKLRGCSEVKGRDRVTF